MLFLFYTRSLCARWSGGLLCLKSRFSLCPSRPLSLSVLCARALSLNSALRFVFLFIFEITNQKKDIFLFFKKVIIFCSLSRCVKLRLKRVCDYMGPRRTELGIIVTFFWRRFCCCFLVSFGLSCAALRSLFGGSRGPNVI